MRVSYGTRPHPQSRPAGSPKNRIPVDWKWSFLESDMRLWALPLLVLCGTMIGCTHLKGIVYEDRPGTGGGRPMRSAMLSIGRPDGIAVYGTHSVDTEGRFDFYIGPTDLDNIFIYDGAADPTLTMHRLEPTQLSDHMVLRLRRASSGTPALPGEFNINP
jgi:hypothetical protein